MALSDIQVKEVADALWRAEKERTPIGPPTESSPEMDIADAYRVQLAGIGLRTKGDPAGIIGWKVGLTSKAMQQMLGVDQPDFGHLLEGTLVEEGTDIVRSDMIWPRVEPEVAFQLKDDIKGPGVTAANVLAATAYLIPALEVIDSRVRDWKIKLCDTIADNASCGRFVLGRNRTPPIGVNTKIIGMNYYVDKNLVSTATTAAVVGDPAEAVAWLANTLAPYGHYLRAGQYIMPGSLVAAVEVSPGSRIRADFDHIGSVEVGIE
jgi:2-keto-4-pentenoate hydratase